jgi:hypothetical protein
MKRAAEQKKVEKRKAIISMREELKKLLEDNETQPAERRMAPADFIIDREYAQLLEQRGVELCEVGLFTEKAKRLSED